LASFGSRPDPEHYVMRLAEQWKGAGPNVAGEVAYDPISPAHGVKAYLDRHPAGLLALTTQARTGLRRVLLGAAAAAIIQASVVPALVVPPPQS
jgi:nucleotide-binding universal stress UspA family protein